MRHVAIGRHTHKHRKLPPNPPTTLQQRGTCRPWISKNVAHITKQSLPVERPSIPVLTRVAALPMYPTHPQAEAQKTVPHTHPLRSHSVVQIDRGSQEMLPTSPNNPLLSNALPSLSLLALRLSQSPTRNVLHHQRVGLPGSPGF